MAFTSDMHSIQRKRTAASGPDDNPVAFIEPEDSIPARKEDLQKIQLYRADILRHCYDRNFCNIIKNCLVRLSKLPVGYMCLLQGVSF